MVEGRRMFFLCRTDSTEKITTRNNRKSKKLLHFHGWGAEDVLYISVADPGWLSRIPDPDFYPSRIPDPKTATKDRGENFFFVKPFFVATNFTKLNIILFLICWRKKFCPIFKNYWSFYPKNCHQALKIWVWDPGSEIRDPEKTYSGSRIQGSKRHRITDPQHCFICSVKTTKYLHRVQQSCVWLLPKYWPPHPPLLLASVSSPAPKVGGVHYTLAGWWGGGGQYFGRRET